MKTLQLTTNEQEVLIPALKTLAMRLRRSAKREDGKTHASVVMGWLDDARVCDQLLQRLLARH